MTKIQFDDINNFSCCFYQSQDHLYEWQKGRTEAYKPPQFLWGNLDFQQFVDKLKQVSFNEISSL